MDRAFATLTVDLGSIPGWVKSKTIKIGIPISNLLCLTFSNKMGQRELLYKASTSSVVDRWAGGSLTRIPIDTFAVFCLKQLGE